MTTTNSSNGQTDHTQVSAVRLTDTERKLVERVDERASDQKAKRGGVFGRLLSSPLVIY